MLGIVRWSVVFHQYKRWRWWRSCVCCEQLIFNRLPLCFVCRRRLYLNFIKNLEEISFHGSKRKIPVLSLWSWNNENHRLVQKLIVALKNGANPNLYQLFTGWMLIKCKHHNIKLVNPAVAFVSIPSADRKHPKALGKTYAVRTQGSFFNILYKKKNKNQKGLSKAERKKVQIIKLSFKKTVPKCLNLLDDVYATGASAEASIMALQSHQIEYILVWAEKQL